MKLRRTTILLCIVLLLVLPACTKDTGEGKTFNFPIDDIPMRLDPAIVESAAEQTVINNCFEGLVRQDAQGNIVPGVAERWEISPDGLTYTFYLREDARWQLHPDAQAMLDETSFSAMFDTRVTAADFEFGLRHALDPATNAPDVEVLYPIVGAKAAHEGTMPIEKWGLGIEGDSILIITLAQPSATFLHTLTQSVAMPCKQLYFNACKGRYGLEPKYLLCNGPFFLSRWDTTSLRLRPSESYAGPFPASPNAVNLKVQANPEECARQLGAENGFDAAILPSGTQTENAEMTIPLENATLALIFNSETLPSASVRKALCLALDPRQLGSTDRNLLPACVRVDDKTLRSLAGQPKGLSQNTTQAESLLQSNASGPLKLRLLCAPQQEQRMRHILQQWQSCFGLQVTCIIETLEPADLAQQLRSGNFDAAITSLQSRSSFAVQALRDFSVESPMRFRSKTLDALLSAAAQTSDAAETARACLQAEEHLLQNGVAYPLAPQTQSFVTAKGTVGFTLSPAGDYIFFAGCRKLG
jgi:oligopeptide transport system substrate-binding protein